MSPDTYPTSLSDIFSPLFNYWESFGFFLFLHFATFSVFHQQHVYDRSAHRACALLPQVGEYPNRYCLVGRVSRGCGVAGDTHPYANRAGPDADHSTMRAPLAGGFGGLFWQPALGAAPSKARGRSAMNPGPRLCGAEG